MVQAVTRAEVVLVALLPSHEIEHHRAFPGRLIDRVPEEQRPDGERAEGRVEAAQVVVKPPAEKQRSVLMITPSSRSP